MADEAAPIIAIMTETGLFSHERLSAMADWLDDYLTNGKASMYRFLSCRAEGRKTIGYSCYGPHWLTDSVFDVYGLAVAPGQQRQGMGAALLRETEGHICTLSGDLALIELSGSPRFQPAHHFLERRGYRLEATIADFYAEGESQLIYTKNPGVQRAGHELLAGSALSLHEDGRRAVGDRLDHPADLGASGRSSHEPLGGLERLEPRLQLAVAILQPLPLAARATT